MDFSALPPEVNSARLYAGPGAGSLTEAAGAWSTLSAQLYAAADEYGSVITSLAASWSGPSSTAMQSSVRPYLAWLTTSAAQAQTTASQARQAAAAFSTALAASVPPPLIAANRAQLAALIASNVFGQNAPAIAANEAQYAAMWAQDAAAMNTYAASAQASTAALPQFTNAPQTAAPTQAATPAAAAPLDSIFGSDSIIGQYLQALVSSGYPVDIVGLFSNFFGPFLGSSIIAGQIATGNAILAGKPSAPMAVYPPTGTAAAEEPPISASAGSANQLGRLSVPPSWATSPQTKPGPARPIVARMEGNPKVGIPVPPAIPIATAGRSAQRKVREDPEYGAVSKVLPPRHPAGG